MGTSSTTRAIFVGGTASHVGKSWIATAICRWLRNRGYSVAPFKSQNMSNNSCACADGSEIGRAQAVQAEACGLAPTADMNPILLKPESDVGCQVVLEGSVWKTLPARAYYEHYDFLLGRVLAAYARLASKYDYIVMEGAGSIAELNLKKRDLVNLPLAARVGARALLVGDVDRGGVFASIVGTLALLEPAEKQLVRSWLVNRFRGDPELFRDGMQILEERTGLRGLGNIPYLAEARIAEEDAVSVENLNGAAGEIAIVRLPRISNFTDFDLLPNPRWITEPDGHQYRCVILPGTKNTVADLRWLRSRGFDDWLLRQHANGSLLLGICGGFQMLGESVEDNGEVTPGLGLLPVTTTMRDEKNVRPVKGRTAAGTSFEAYEIHMGETSVPPSASPFAFTEHGSEGIRTGNCIGTYLHGVLDEPEVVREILGVEPVKRMPKDQIYDSMANCLDRFANMKLFEDLYL